MDLVLKLRESSVRLAQLENRLCSERADLIKCANASLSGTSDYFTFLSMVNKVNEIVKDYKDELAVFDAASQSMLSHHQTDHYYAEGNEYQDHESVSSASSIADIADLLIGSVAVPDSFSESNFQPEPSHVSQPTEQREVREVVPHHQEVHNRDHHQDRLRGLTGLSAMSEPHQIDNLLSSLHLQNSPPDRNGSIGMTIAGNSGHNGHSGHHPMNGLNVMGSLNGHLNGHHRGRSPMSNGLSNVISNVSNGLSNGLSNNQLAAPQRKVRSATSSPPVAAALNGHGQSGHAPHALLNGANAQRNGQRNGLTSSKSKPLLKNVSQIKKTKSGKSQPVKQTIAAKLSKKNQASLAKKAGSKPGIITAHNKSQAQQQQSSRKNSNSKQFQYKYGGTGYDVWRKNGQVPLWTETELYCLKTFGKNGNDRAKLKRFLVKKGGFSSGAIKFVKPQSTKYPNNTFHFAFITVQDSLSEIRRCVARINALEDSPQELIRINRRKCSRGTTQCTCLFVTNFDILTKDDHRLFTELFAQFGPLEKDVFMNRSTNGVNYAFVRFRKMEDALSCYHNQNDESWQAEPLYFNDRKLQIGFDEKGGRTINR